MSDELERKKAVADIMKREIGVVQAAAERRHPRLRSVLPLLLSLAPVFVGLTAWNIMRARDDGPVIPTEDVEASVRFSIYLTAQELNAYQDSVGSLPPSLTVVGMEDDGIVYSRGETGYVLTARVGDRVLQYRQGDSWASFAAAYDLLAREVPE
jgi:hypothetical protein